MNDVLSHVESVLIVKKHTEEQTQRLLTKLSQVFQNLTPLHTEINHACNQYINHVSTRS